jgi:hypothetical protein
MENLAMPSIDKNMQNISKVDIKNWFARQQGKIYLHVVIDA